MEEALKPSPPLPGEKALAGFLTRARLGNGTSVNMDPDSAGLLAQAIVHFQAGEVWQDGKWAPAGEVIPDPQAGDIRVEHLYDGAVVKMLHVPTGVTAMSESEDEAWDDLRRKVKEHGE
ncbi:hypothetical protein AALF15_01400 [Corynebacteriaceae bacterium 7-707]